MRGNFDTVSGHCGTNGRDVSRGQKLPGRWSRPSLVKSDRRGGRLDRIDVDELTGGEALSLIFVFGCLSFLGGILVLELSRVYTLQTVIRTLLSLKFALKISFWQIRFWRKRFDENLFTSKLPDARQSKIHQIAILRKLLSYPLAIHICLLLMA